MIVVALDIRFGTFVGVDTKASLLFGRGQVPDLKIVKPRLGKVVILVIYVLVAWGRAIIGTLFVGVDWFVWIEVVLTFVAAASLSILFHFGVIAQISALRLLFNGQARGPKFGLREYLEWRKN